MKIIRTFETAEMPNPHSISARLLHTGENEQFEHLMLEPGQGQKQHASFTTVHLYVLEGTGTLEANDETIQLTPDTMVVMPPETVHRLLNNGGCRLRVLNIKAPRPVKAPRILND